MKKSLVPARPLACQIISPLRPNLAHYEGRFTSSTEPQRRVRTASRTDYSIAKLAKPASALLHETEVGTAVDAMPQRLSSKAEK